MAGKAQEVQVGDINIGRVGDTGGKQLEGNGHRDGGLHHSSTCSKTSTGFSEHHIDNETGNLHRCSLTSLGAYGVALGEMRMS